MCLEHYLEYLVLDSIMQEWLQFSLNIPEICDNFYFADNTKVQLNLTKLKARITELQKMFLKEYLCTDSASKEE